MDIRKANRAVVLTQLLRYPHLSWTAWELCQLVGWTSSPAYSKIRMQRALEGLQERGFAVAEQAGVHGRHARVLWQLAPRPLDVSSALV